MGSPLADKVSHIPELSGKNGKSTAVLLKDAGLPETSEPLRVRDVEDALQQEPELVDLWLERGSDQRIAGGWGIERGKDGFYRVVSYSGGPAMTEPNRLKACAEFIVRYVAFIGDVLRRWH